MAETTEIEWADATVNFWVGCKKVSRGCKFCYMYRHQHRFNQDGSKVTRAANPTFNAALTWKEPKKIFTCSLSDFFLKEADQWREEAWNVIRATPQHQWLILTKRPERIAQCLPKDWGKGYDNVWLGVSVESQKTLHRIGKLLEIPAKIRFLSIEPILEKIDIAPFLSINIPGTKKWAYPIHWVIVGGETGNDNGDHLYRPAKLDWIHQIVKDCKEAEVPVFVKQLGTALYKQLELKDRAGADHDTPNFPVYLKPRELPSIAIP